MAVNLQDKVQRHPNLVFAHMGDEVVMMSDDQSDYLGLNGVASKIWTMLENPLTVQELCEGLQTEFDVGREQCEQDVVIFLDDMKQRGLIRVLD